MIAKYEANAVSEIGYGRTSCWKTFTLDIYQHLVHIFAAQHIAQMTSALQVCLVDNARDGCADHA